MEKAIHDGHRQRMRERIQKSGIGALEPHEVLEYLLFSFVPRRDTNALAHRLIDEFGSFSAVLSTSAERLAKVSGMTMNAAIFLSNLPEVFRMYLNEIDNPRHKLKGRGAVRQTLMNKLFGETKEVVYVAALDSHEQLIATKLINTGSGDSVDMSTRNIVDFALTVKASGIVLAHNHPSGAVEPSKADVDMTFQLMITLANVKVELLDHFIFSGSNYYSFEENNRLSNLKNSMDSILKEGIFFYE